MRQIRRALDCTQVEFADLIGVTGNNVARWERNERAISEPVARFLRLIARLHAEGRIEAYGLHPKKAREVRR
jgi:DNA-binding transcriptional regulator YiaG